MIFSRDTKPIKLPSSRSGDRSVTVEVGDLNDEEMDTLAIAFEEGQDFQWLHTHEDGSMNIDQLHKGSRYLMDCVVNFSRRNGYVVVARDAETRQYLGSICLIRSYERNWVRMLHFMASVIKYGRPVQETMGKTVKSKFYAFNMIEKYHKEVMPDPHWYVATVGVASSAQGRGIGKRLLTIAADIAQRDRLPVYLECHDGNVAFYEKLGYDNRRRVDLVPKSNPSLTLPFNFMILDPREK